MTPNLTGGSHSRRVEHLIFSNPIQTFKSEGFSWDLQEVHGNKRYSRYRWSLQKCLGLLQILSGECIYSVQPSWRSKYRKVAKAPPSSNEYQHPEPDWPISIIAFLLLMVCDTHGIHGSEAMWLLHFFSKRQSDTALKTRIALKAKSSCKRLNNYPSQRIEKK